jgi:hypothetical protein
MPCGVTNSYRGLLANGFFCEMTASRSIGAQYCTPYRHCVGNSTGSRAGTMHITVCTI